MELIQNIEEKFECSGMCRRSLFYFGRDITEYPKPPQQTCLVDLVHYVKSESVHFSNTAMLSGTVAIILVVLHFQLYCKKAPEQEVNFTDINLAPNEMEMQPVENDEDHGGDLPEPEVPQRPSNKEGRVDF